LEVQSFNSWDEMMSAINEARIVADGRVKDWQSAIKPGDHFIQSTEYGFYIFGEVLESDDDYYRSDEGKNYRFCRCYSVAVPDSECGDVHVSVIGAIISKEVFEKFREMNWNVDFPE
jgi:hypothetical protein